MIITLSIDKNAAISFDYSDSTISEFSESIYLHNILAVSISEIKIMDLKRIKMHILLLMNISNIS